MKKTLITAGDIDSHLCPADGRLYVGNDTILTAGAKDELARRRITVVYGEAPKACGREEAASRPQIGAASDAPALADGITGVVKAVSTMLEQQYGVTDPAEIEKLTVQALTILKNNA